jgi:hypothetical protein
MARLIEVSGRGSAPTLGYRPPRPEGARWLWIKLWTPLALLRGSSEGRQAEHCDAVSRRPNTTREPCTQERTELAPPKDGHVGGAPRGPELRWGAAPTGRPRPRRGRHPRHRSFERPRVAALKARRPATDQPRSNGAVDIPGVRGDHPEPLWLSPSSAAARVTVGSGSGLPPADLVNADHPRHWATGVGTVTRLFFTRCWGASGWDRVRPRTTGWRPCGATYLPGFMTRSGL